MCVNVDEAGRHDETGSVDLVPCGTDAFPDLHDLLTVDGDICFERLTARAIDDPAAAHNKIEDGCQDKTPSKVNSPQDRGCTG